MFIVPPDAANSVCDGAHDIRTFSIFPCVELFCITSYLIEDVPSPDNIDIMLLLSIFPHVYVMPLTEPETDDACWLIVSVYVSDHDPEFHDADALHVTVPVRATLLDIDTVLE